MIFLLTKSLLNINKYDENILLGIEKISQEIMQGNNFLLVESVAVADHIFAIYGEGMSIFSKKVIHKSKTSLPTLNAILKNNFVCIALVDDVNLCGYERMIDIRNLYCFDVGKPVLLCENMTDSRILGFAAKCYLASKKLISETEVKYFGRGGGGTCISVELDAVVNGGNGFCMVVTDGDNNFPDRPISVVSKKCDSVVRLNGNISGHFILPVRDLENLIPVGIYWESLDGGMMDKVGELKEIIDKDFRVAIHCDIKEGLRGEKFYSISSGSAERVFLEELADRRVLSLDSECVGRGDCLDGATCSCVLVPGVGGKSLERVADFFDKNTPHKINEYFSGKYKIYPD